MNFTEYQHEATTSAIYPDRGNNLIYPMLGLMGESGEVAEKIKKMIRDDQGKMTADRRTALRGELGDVLWYIAAICEEAKLDMGYLYVLALGVDFKAYPLKNISRLIFKLQQQVSHISLLIEQAVYEPSKKNIDPLSPLPTDITILIGLVDEICILCGLNIQEVAKFNLQKLASRKQRGVLQGSGDNR